MLNGIEDDKLLDLDLDSSNYDVSYNPLITETFNQQDTESKIIPRSLITKQELENFTYSQILNETNNKNHLVINRSHAHSISIPLNSTNALLNSSTTNNIIENCSEFSADETTNFQKKIFDCEKTKHKSSEHLATNSNYYFSNQSTNFEYLNKAYVSSTSLPDYSNFSVKISNRHIVNNNLNSSNISQQSPIDNGLIQLNNPAINNTNNKNSNHIQIVNNNNNNLIKTSNEHKKRGKNNEIIKCICKSIYDKNIKLK